MDEQKNSTLKVIAIETHDVSDNPSAARIYKALKPETPYFLYKGYHIQNGQLEGTPTGFDPYNTGDGVRIEVCALVGENGSGKSSLIELMIRAVNNFACCVLGEYRANANTAHLHYIENVRATIHFIKGNDTCSLYVHDNTVELTIGGTKVFTPQGKRTQSDIIIGVDCEDYEQYPEHFTEAYAILDQFFYTIVNNFSLYAYNSRDFKPEDTAEDKAKQIFESAKKHYQWEDSATIESQDYNWLTGVFYKNDGYTTPIVLSPMRVEGNISINDENDFAQDRQLSLLLHKNGENYPFRTINGTKEVRSITLENIEESTKGMGDKSVVQHVILTIAQELFGLSYNKTSPANQAAETYFVNKSIKIAQNYPEFRFLGRHLFEENESSLEKLRHDALTYLTNLITNPSHITQKWRQTLAFLKFQHYKPGTTLTIAEVEKEIESKLGKTLEKQIEINATYDEFSRFLGKQPLPKLCFWAKEDLLPPVVFNPQLELFEGETKIPFNTLSSGERQLIYFVNSVVYHLINVNSAQADENPRAKYRNALVVLEEVELYFHPDLQRRLVKMLLEAIRSASLNLDSVQLLFVTHSPFVLSDIPEQNCLFLKKNEENKGEPSLKPMKTFGANIHEILNSGFFMEHGNMGAFAQEFVKQLIAKVNLLYARIIYKGRETLLDAFEKEYESVKVDFEDLPTLEEQADLIQEPLISSELTQILAKIKEHKAKCGN